MSSSRIHRGQGYEPPTRSKRDNASRQEDRLIALIEGADQIRRYEKILAKVADGEAGIPDLYKAAAADAFIVTVDIMHAGDSDKVRLEAAKDVLDRAGHGKTHKVQVGGQIHVDHDTSKLELINLIVSSAKRAGLPVKDSPALPEPKEPETIDVTPAAEATLVGIDEEPPEGAA